MDLSFITSTYVIQFMIEYLATKGLDFVYNRVKDVAQKDGDLELQIYNVLNDSLREFCEKIGLEYDAAAKYDKFILSVKEISLLNNESKLKEIIEKTIDTKIDDLEFKNWTEIIFKNITADKNQRLFRALQLSYLYKKTDRFIIKPWMKKYLYDNFYEAPYGNENLFNSFCSGIITNLTDECWIDTRQLLIELSLNAQIHGKANKCLLIISGDRIIIKDNGKKFDINNLISDDTVKGGGWTLTRYMKKYPEIQIEYEYKKSCNITTIDFLEKVFDISSLCKIDVPEIISREIQIQLKYSDGKAKYYFMDFEDPIDLEGSNLLYFMSGVDALFNALYKHSLNTDSEVFIYIPVSDKYELINLLEMARKVVQFYKDKIHLINE